MATYEQIMTALRNADAAGDTAAATRLAQMAREAKAAQQNGAAALTDQAAPPVPQTGLRDQAMSGVNEGVADMLGFPVDALTGAINGGAGLVNSAFGTEIPAIQNPVGGSQSMRSLMAPTISDVAPQTAGQRFARSVGREVGVSAIPVAATAGRGLTAGRMALEGASAVGGGVAQQTAAEVTDNPWIQAGANLTGSLFPIGASRAMRAAPTGPTMDDLRAAQKAAYDQVEAAKDTVTPTSRQALVEALSNRMAGENIDPLLNPKASRALELATDNLPANATIADIERKRRFIGNNVAGALDDSERRLGVAMKEEIENYLNSLTPADMRGADPEATLGALREGREVTGRIKKSSLVDALVEKGERRAATSGTGGNEVNAIRQNLRSILDDPKKARGFTPAERKMIDAVVRGDTTTNALRLVGRLSPTSGALPLMGALGASAAAGAAANPIFALPGAAGFLAKAGAEARTVGKVTALAEALRNGGPVATKTMSGTELAAARTALLRALSGVSD